MVNPMMVLDKVELRRGGRVIVGPISLGLRDAGVTMAMGPNGAGKTTLLRALHGLERVSSGQIRWAESAEALRARQAFVFQTPILMRRSVLDSIAYPLRLKGVSRGEARERAAACAETVGLRVRLKKDASTLSGGEKQKMALARALITEPALLFLDEPSANLDGRSTREIEEILTHIRAGGTRIVMSTHDIGQARRLADEVVFLHDGRLVEQASSAAFFDAPQSNQAYAYLQGDIVI
ncbi:ATP-binding cassette domain-containing protein [Antarcticimicrobium sediminis]|uniref:ATP-binding cassette domain-containing protein n=1 Tax=Antarcticimicrobium sediminis TaxID=2546227 RepID=A0A4R5EY95_9RHOB|nr:ATP-binding cassette domain-containing protein [Antarcticimicrobium sediminis]TDE40049.1 ATP-binding cassette domain-containing protein [Antarcticimicrobium sediminis]